MNQRGRLKGGCSQDWLMPHTFRDANCAAALPTRISSRSAGKIQCRRGKTGYKTNQIRRRPQLNHCGRRHRVITVAKSRWH